MKRHMQTRALCGLAIAALLGLSACSTGGDAATSKAQAADYPRKPITIIVWSAPGSGVDVMARQAAPLLKAKFGQPVLVVNKTGGDGAVAMQYILSKPADGYTIGVNTRSQMVSLNTDLKGKINFDQFTYIADMESDPYVLAVRSDSKIKTLKDFTVAANSKDFSVGGFGAKSAHSLYSTDLTDQLGVHPSYIPFKGGSEATTNLLGGHVQAALTNVGQVVGLVKGGKVRVIGVSTEKPMSQLPNAPTFASLGIKNLTVSHWRGFYAKKGTPDAVINKLSDAFRTISEDSGWKQYLDKNGLASEYVPHSSWSSKAKNDFETLAEKLG